MDVSDTEIKVCKKCNKAFTSGKCEHCNSLYQASCARLQNIVKFVSDSAVNFSEKVFQNDNDGGVSSDAAEDESADEKVALE